MAHPSSNQTHDFDYLVVGSGFGGSVAALRLVEKGYPVGVIEMGRRYRDDDFPESAWNVRDFFWNPRLGLRGIFQMRLFRHAYVLTGVGVGGGSLVYANTLLEPPESVWQHPQWAHLRDWRSVLAPHFAEARRMLGVTRNPYAGLADQLLMDEARRQGFGASCYATDVGVFFGEPGVRVPDPYFGGAGPDRAGCIHCGGCMMGCRHGAKNTLVKNYLYLAERGGARIIPETKVVGLAAMGAGDGTEGYRVEVVDTFGGARSRRVLTAKGVVLAAGVLGTVELLLRVRATLPRLSPRVGHHVRTNAESILALRFDGDVDLTDGIAIGSGFYLDDHTHVEAVRYARGADAVGLLTTLFTAQGAGAGRVAAWLGQITRHPMRFIRMLNPFGFARNTLIVLVMQTVESSIRLRLRRTALRGERMVTEGPKIAANIPAANAFVERMAAHHGATPLTAVTEILFDVPTTAHILGGAAMGAGPDEGVVDPHGRVFGYENLYVCDGSIIGANLGVNPSLTITALAEYVMDGIF